MLKFLLFALQMTKSVSGYFSLVMENQLRQTENCWHFHISSQIESNHRLQHLHFTQNPQFIHLNSNNLANAYLGTKLLAGLLEAFESSFGSETCMQRCDYSPSFSNKRRFIKISNYMIA